MTVTINAPSAAFIEPAVRDAGDETHWRTRERIHRAVGTCIGRSKWFAAAVDISNRCDTNEFDAPDRARPYLVLATTKWRCSWSKTRFDLAITPISGDEQPVSAEVAKHAFEKYRLLAAYRAALSWQGSHGDTLATWGQQ